MTNNTNVDDVLTAMYALEATVSGTHPFDAPPDSLPETDQPMWVNVPGAATYDWVSAGEEGESDSGGTGYIEGFETREYEARLHVCPIGDGISGEAVNRLRPWYPAGRDLFMAHPTLGGLPGIQGVTTLGDPGMRTLLYAGAEWWSVVTRVLIKVRVRVAFVAGE